MPRREVSCKREGRLRHGAAAYPCASVTRIHHEKLSIQITLRDRWRRRKTRHGHCPGHYRTTQQVSRRFRQRPLLADLAARRSHSVRELTNLPINRLWEANSCYVEGPLTRSVQLLCKDGRHASSRT